MRRRDFITLLGGTAATWPLGASAQQPALPVIGYLSSGTPQGFARLVDAFRQGLNEAGFVEARNVGIEFRWSEGQDETAGRPEMAEKPKLSEMLSSFAIVWAIRLIVALFALTFLCGVIVIILRYVFRIEIWNPFHQIL
jgi:hypothetical protein